MKFGTLSHTIAPTEWLHFTPHTYRVNTPNGLVGGTRV